VGLARRVKLAAALDHFGLEVAGLTGLDIGASTGGFTEVLLERGAQRVYAVDVGHDQLHSRLRADARVVAIDGVNARTLDRQIVAEPIGAVVCDASFIGLETVLPAPLALVGPAAFLVALVKPQFEAGPGAVDKHGIVRNAADRRRHCDRIAGWLGAQAGWTVLGIIDSPILGRGGNHEFLLAGRYRA